ncbi:MAG: O-methyltransferase [SAR324 cluster bacterium]|nr:O-methyltransferase [SAR324 cluster bacterium]
MTPEVEAVLARLHERMAEDQRQREILSKEEWDAGREARMLAIGEEAGRFLNLLIRAAGARNLLELGTSVGYSTIWLAEAARANGGQVTTVDENEDKTRQARETLAAAGLAEVVTFITGDAVQVCAGQQDLVDFVLLDVWKGVYIPCFEAVLPKLAVGGLIAADNMTFPVTEQAPLYQARVRGTGGMQSAFVPIGNGFELSLRVS